MKALLGAVVEEEEKYMIEPTTKTPDDPGLVRAKDIVRDEWGKQGWHFPLRDHAGAIQQGIEDVRACGINRLIARRYSDFDDRVRSLANLIAAMALLLATPGHAANAEYMERLRHEMSKLLPFLDKPVREGLARRLIAAQHGTEVEDSELVSADQSA
jgi:hypothetical protein